MLSFRMIEGGSNYTPPFKATCARFGKGERVTPKQLMDIIIDNEDDGLWLYYNSEYTKEFIEALEEVGKTSFPLLITTEQNDNEFYKEIGEFIASSSGFDAKNLTTLMMDVDSESFYVMIGVTALDAYLPKGYLIRFGEEDMKNIEIGEMHGVKTFSKNQKVIKVRRDRL